MAADTFLRACTTFVTTTNIPGEDADRRKKEQLPAAVNRTQYVLSTFCE